MARFDGVRIDTGRYVDAAAGLQRALSGVSNNLGKYTAREDARAQTAVLNQRADAQLAIQQQAAIRNQKTFDMQQQEIARKKKQRELLNATAASPDLYTNQEAANISKGYEQFDAANSALSDEEYQAKLMDLNSTLTSGYQNRKDKPLIGQKEYARRVSQGMIDQGVDVQTANKVATDKAALLDTPKVADNKMLRGVVQDIYKADNKLSNSLLTQGKTGNKKTKVYANAASKKLKEAGTMYDWIDQNANKTTLFTSISGEDSGYSLKDATTKFLEEYPAAAVQAAMKRSFNGTDGTMFDTRTVDVDDMAMFLKQWKDNGSIKALGADGSANRKIAMDKAINLQNKRNAKYAADMNSLATVTTPVDKKKGMSSSQLAFGTTADDLKNRFGIVLDAPAENTVSGNVHKPSTAKFTEAPGIGDAMRSKENGLLLKMANGNPKQFETEYNAISDAERLKVDRALSNSVVPDGFKGYTDTVAPKQEVAAQLQRDKKIKGLDTKIAGINDAIGKVTNEADASEVFSYGMDVVKDRIGGLEGIAKERAIKNWTIIDDPNSSKFDTSLAYAGLAGNGLIAGIEGIGELIGGAAFTSAETIGNSAIAGANFFRDGGDGQLDNISAIRRKNTLNAELPQLTKERAALDPNALPVFPERDRFKYSAAVSEKEMVAAAASRNENNPAYRQSMAENAARGNRVGNMVNNGGTVPTVQQVPGPNVADGRVDPREMQKKQFLGMRSEAMAVNSPEEIKAIKASAEYRMLNASQRREIDILMAR